MKLFASRDTSQYLHGALRTVVFLPLPFFTPYPFLPLGKKGALISDGWDAKHPHRSLEIEAAWPHGLTKPFKLRCGPWSRFGDRQG